MSGQLPEIPAEGFERRLRELSPEPLDASVLAALFTHYEELRRWNPHLSLVGPGTAEEVLERHYGESLAALPWVGGDGVLIDIGSGGGFPGLVLAAARPGLEVHLIEPRQRKWAFLQTAARRAALPCRCLNVRVAAPLPAGFPPCIDFVTVRAVKVAPEILLPLRPRLSDRSRVLLWSGREEPELPAGFTLEIETPLARGEHRRLRIYRPT